MEVKVIVSLPVIIIVALVAVAGYIILSKVVGKKWGYTEKREKELENASGGGLFPGRRKH